MKSSDSIRSFEHAILRCLRAEICQDQKILLAVSGGLDSMVMLSALAQWQRHLRIKLIVAHVHHGKGSKDQRHFRDRVQIFLSKYCAKNGFEFVTNGKENFSSAILKSEASLRDFRWSLLKKWQIENSCNAVAVAHHSDDLLETQILRLIRGTSGAGLVAMSSVSEGKIRPLLGQSRAEIKKYAKAKRLKWVEDPSNRKNSAALRNWVRNKWLPALEKRSPGAKKSLARSLGEISQMTLHTPASHSEIWANGGMRRSALARMTKKQQSNAVIEYLHRLGLTNYQQSQVKELLRRLDSRKNNTRFSMLGLSWDILPDLVLASRV